MNFLHERQLRRLDAHGSTRAVEAPPRVSFEFFPPKNPQMETQLWTTIKALEPLLPEYVSVTYGAGGSTRDATFETVRRIAAKTHLRPAAHLTCVGHGRKDIAQLLERYWEAGVRHIIALRGDHPAGGGSTPPDGLAFAADLVAFIKTIADFEISVAAYPETHPQAQSADADLDNLKRKLDAGASRAITQYFSTARRSSSSWSARAGPGSVRRSCPAFCRSPTSRRWCASARCAERPFRTGCTICSTASMTSRHPQADGRHGGDRAVSFAQAEGVTDFHFYTLNRADLILGICRRMGLKPAPLPDQDGFADAPAPMQRDPEMPD